MCRIMVDTAAASQNHQGNNIETISIEMSTLKAQLSNLLRRNSMPSSLASHEPGSICMDASRHQYISPKHKSSHLIGLSPGSIERRHTMAALEKENHRRPQTY